MHKFRFGFLFLFAALLAIGPVVFVTLVPEDEAAAPTKMESSGKEVPAGQLASGWDTAPVQGSGQPAGTGTNDPSWTALEQGMRHDHQGLVEVTHASGRRSVFLDGRFTQMAVAVRDESGRLHLRCFSDFQGMRKFLEQPQVTSTTSSHEHPAAY